MAKAVAILEGDSTKLVQAIGDAKTAMQKLEPEARKLSDQIRDVKDEADKAAGAFTQKLGGPGLVKAIAGIGTAMFGAQQALGAFTGSMSAFYSLQGEAGAKAMADIDTALNKMQSQLFTAVLGTDNMEEATKTLISGIEGLTTVIGVLLTPLEWAGKFMKALRDFTNESANAAERQAEKLNLLKETQVKIQTSYANNKKAIEGNQRAVDALTGAHEDLRKAQLRSALSATDALAEQVKLAEKEADIAEYKRLVAAGVDENERRARQAASDVLAATGDMKLYNETYRNSFEGLQKQTRDEAKKTVMVMSEETIAQLQSLGAQRQVLASELLGVTEEIRKEEEARANRRNRTGGTPAAGPVTTGDDAKKKAEEEAAAKIAAIKAETDALIAKQRQEWAAEDALELRKEKTEEKNARITAETEARYKEEAAARTATYAEIGHAYGDLIGGMIAEDKKAADIAIAVGRKAIGGVINALGDKAMAEAGIYASALDPRAFAMVAAGTAAYAAAAVLGYTGKKAASSTPASAKPEAQQVNQSVSYNLQVDAAFANGESIARQFAMAQREAQRRGMGMNLGTAGAF